VLVAERGTWHVGTPRNEAGLLGLLVLDGLLVRRVNFAGVAFAELLGAGDVLRPWSHRSTEVAQLPAESSWEVVVPARLAVLDRRFALSVARWPEITAAVLDRAIRRARGLALQLAVCHLHRLDLRLQIMFWHLAERWGHVTPDGVHLPMTLTHDQLADIVGARRPSVSAALARLRKRRLVTRRPDGTWLLCGEAPAELMTLQAATSLPAGVSDDFGGAA
jgi:DNA-binding transcriptional ArsR family regulator